MAIPVRATPPNRSGEIHRAMIAAVSPRQIMLRVTPLLVAQTLPSSKRSFFMSRISLAMIPFAVLSAFLFASGCSKPNGMTTYPVRGIVRFPDNKVVRNGSVEFESIGLKPPITARGTINPDGSFELGTYTRDDGAVAGKHRVIVVSQFVIGNGVERPGLIPTNKLHSKYSQYRTSGLEITIKPEDNTVFVDVDYADSAKEQMANGKPANPDREKKN